MGAGAGEHIEVEEIASGGLGEFGSLRDCDGSLPPDLNPQVIQFVRFALFEALPGIRPVDPRYVIVLPRQAAPEARAEHPVDDRRLAALARRAVEELAAPELPAPSGQNIAEIRKVLVNRQSTTVPGIATGSVPEPEPLASDRRLLAGYRRFVADRRRSFVRSRIAELLPAGHELLHAEVLDPVASLTTALTETVHPAASQPVGTPLPLLALCLTFEQVWQPLGYTRGELLSTISLAPGEQLTIEVHLWDKSTVKSEQELAQESEFRSSEKMTQRDSLSVVQEYARKSTTHVNASLQVPLGKFNIGAGGDATDEITRRNQETKDQVREGTAEASQSLKETRKMRIEISRETGREDKQTRTINNTNRCHTLNCHYFEIVANYAVTTKLATITPCVLLANGPIYVTPAWVLCYQDVLTKVLLDKVFLPGFDAARTLRIQEITDELRQQQEQGAPDFVDPGPDRAAQLADAILKPGRALLRAVKTFNDAVIENSQVFNTTLQGATLITVAGSDDDGIRFLVYSGSVSGKLRDALSQLDAARQATSPFDALKALFSRVSVDDFHPAVVPTTIAQGLLDQGMNSIIVNELLRERVLEKPTNDDGLIAAAQNAWDTLHAAAPAQPQPAPADPAAQQAADAALNALATAQADFDQLKCHIEANLMHYAHAVWEWEDADQRLLRLEGSGPILSVIDNILLGFLADRAAYPLIDITAADGVRDLGAILDEIRKGIPDQHDEPILVTHPTPGTVVETVLGECDACETYIEQSRLIDLRQRGARADQEVEEARRRQMRLDKQPPDLSDFIPFNEGRVVVNIDNDAGDEQESG